MSMMDDQRGGGMSLQNMETNGRLLIQAINGLQQTIEAGFTSTLWVAYTPTVSANVGTFSSVSATGRFAQTGKTVNFSIQVTITTNGTAADAVIATMPIVAQSANIFTFAGRENGVTGVGLVGFLITTSTIFIQRYDATYPGGDGRILAISGSYEAA